VLKAIARSDPLFGGSPELRDSFAIAGHSWMYERSRNSSRNAWRSSRDPRFPNPVQPRLTPEEGCVSLRTTGEGLWYAC
jgi:hypothetical protein